MPDPGSARKETIVQRAVAAAGFPTPPVRAAGGPDDGLGLAFMVMDRARGGPALSGLDGLSPASVPRLLRQIPDLLATSMARLHALDPDLVRGELEQVRDVPVTVPGLLAALARFAGEFGRTDPDRCGPLAGGSPARASSGRYLPRRPAPVQPARGRRPGDRAGLEHRAARAAGARRRVHLAAAQRAGPSRAGWQRPLVRMFGWVLARRFVRGYLRQAGVTVGPGELRWHQAVVCLRALVEVASWVHAGTDGAHAGHPWLINGPVFARRVACLTGAPVRAR
jgi:hypothetical protein